MPSPPKILHLQGSTIVGISAQMSRQEDQTAMLWRQFMPRQSEVDARTSRDVLSMQMFPEGSSQLADPTATFTKWACVEVSSATTVPPEMQAHDMAGGLYAVFEHIGPANDMSTFTFIFGDWIPNSLEYVLDDREHFERLPPGYQPMDPNAREEIWIPIKKRT